VNLCQICARELLIWTVWQVWGDEKTVSYVVSTPVGVSIPSLATVFNDLQARPAEFGCVWLHFYHTAYCTGTASLALNLTNSVSFRTALRCDSGTTC